MQELLNRCVIFLATSVILSACGTDDQAPSAEDTANKIEFSIGDDRYALPIKLCQVSAGFVMIKGWQGVSSAEMSYDGQATNVRLEVEFNEDGVQYKDQWESQPAAEHSTDGFIVTSQGTVTNVSRYRLEDGEGDKWLRLDGSGPLGKRPFQLSANCTES